MNKKSLSEILAQQANMEFKEAGKTVDLVLGIITNSIHGGIPVRLRGFGTFTMRERKPRDLHSNLTGKTERTAGALVPHFKPSPALRKHYGRS